MVDAVLAEVIDQLLALDVRHRLHQIRHRVAEAACAARLTPARKALAAAGLPAASLSPQGGAAGLPSTLKGVVGVGPVTEAPGAQSPRASARVGSTPTAGTRPSAGLVRLDPKALAPVATVVSRDAAAASVPALGPSGSSRVVEGLVW